MSFSLEKTFVPGQVQHESDPNRHDMGELNLGCMDAKKARQHEREGKWG